VSLLSQYVANGLSVSLGLVLVMLAIFEAAGLAAASTAAVGVMITSLPDMPAPRKRKIMQMLPAPLLGAPLFMLVQLVHHDELLLGIVGHGRHLPGRDDDGLGQARRAHLFFAAVFHAVFHGRAAGRRARSRSRCTAPGSWWAQGFTCCGRCSPPTC
jgi:hypothetical protein